MSNKSLPILVGIAVVAATVFFWQALIAQEQAQIEQQLYLQATNAKIQTTELLDELTLGLVRMAKRWEYGGKPSQSLWEADATLFTRHYPTYQAIAWVDPSGYVRWIAPLVGNEAAQNQKLTFEPKHRMAFEAARQQRQVVVTPTIELMQGGNGFLVYVPIFEQDKFGGVIVGIFRTQKLFDAIFNELDKRVGRIYAFAIFEGNKEIYSHYRDFNNKFYSKKWGQETTINFYGIPWRIRVWPEPELLNQKQFPIRELLLGGGLVLAILLSLTISLFQSKQRQTKRLDVTNQNLKREITERQQVESAFQESQERWELVIRGSNDGIWDWNVLTNEVFFSSRWKQMRGFQEHEIGNSLDEWLQSIHPDDIESVMQAVEDYFAKKTPYFSAEYRVRRSDGSYMWILDRGQAIWDEAGNVVRMAGSEKDITARKMAEVAQRESEERFRLLVTFAPVGIFQTDSQGHCLFVNSRWIEMTGFSLEQAQGTGWLSAVHPDDYEQVFAQWHDTSQTGREFSMEYRLRTPQGKVTWVRGSAVAIRGESGEITGYLGSITDITERKFAEEALPESAKREHTLTQVIQRIHQSLDIDTIFSATTEELRQFLKCDRVAIYRFNSDWSGEFVAESVASGWRALISEQKNDPELIGSSLDDENCTTKTFATKSNQLQDTYLQETKGGAYSQGASYLVVEDIYQREFNACYIDLLERFQARAYIIVPIFVSGKLWGLLASFQNSHARQWEATEINIGVQIGAQLGIALQQAELLQETQRQAAQLKEAKEAAEAANRAKSTFLASMSHELRTPLNAILGFSQILAHDEFLAEQQRQHIEIINRSGGHLLELINDILSMSKIEAGQITIDENCFNLYDLLKSIEEMLLFKANAKGLPLKFEYHTDIPQYVQTDEGKLRQVLINLLGNAIKFTHTGSVTLRVIKKLNVESSDLPPLNWQLVILTFEVSDTGCGIDPSERDTLFDPFVQTKTGRKSIEGTGLGLPISRQFVRLMGGDITVSSTPGQGSTFTFDIKMSLASAVDIETTVTQQRVIGLEPNQPSYRLLVVEDVEENRLLLVKLLQPLGFEVCEAVNGQEAVAMYSSWQPHLIMMDIQMPTMDGYEAIQQIRQMPNANGRDTVIIALTASAFEEQRTVILKAGCNDFIRKPFRQEILYEKIALHLGVRYLYKAENQSLSTQQSAQSLVLTKDALCIMPSEWVQNLYQAAITMDEEVVLKLIEQIPETEANLAKTLTNLVDNFRLDIIVDVAQTQL